MKKIKHDQWMMAAWGFLVLESLMALIGNFDKKHQLIFVIIQTVFLLIAILCCLSAVFIVFKKKPSKQRAIMYWKCEKDGQINIAGITDLFQIKKEWSETCLQCKEWINSDLKILYVTDNEKN